MAISAYKVFSDNDVLPAADLNLSFAQIINNAIDLIAPFTKDVAAGGFRVTGLADASATGQALVYGQAINGTTGTFSGAVNKVTITAPATGATFTLTDGKTFSVLKTISLTGTDGTTMTFPTTSATVARSEAAQSFTGLQTFSSGVNVGNADVATASTLDWYLESTFTPVLSFGGGTTGITYAIQTGTHTRMGNTIAFCIDITLTSKGSSSGVAAIGGMPIALRATTPATQIFFTQSTVGSVVAAGGVAGATSLSIYQAGFNTVSDASFANNSVIRIQGVCLV